MNGIMYVDELQLERRLATMECLEDNKYLLLNAANKCLEGGEVPEQMLKAVVVSIYKKADFTSLENHRPISLLTSCYKIVAALFKERLDKGLGARLMQTQYGFRKGNSQEDCKIWQKNRIVAAL